MIKKLFIITILLFTLNTNVIAQTTATTEPALPQATYTDYHNCIRLYKLPFGKLYFLALSAINANNYEILEQQSRNGYIIFQAENKEFLLSVMTKNKNYSFLRLTPADNNYFFNSKIPFKIFNYIDLNFNTEIKELKF